MVSTPQPVDSTRTNFRWMFPPFALDEATLELRRDGRLLAIERKPLEALIFLLRHAGEVVTKDEILAGVWPGRILSDTVLTKCIGRLREVLDDRDQTLIKTVYGFGYRLMAPVRRERLAISEPVEAPELGPEQHPPLRPNWRLERCVGTGATGDTWLARQEKTRELRVFKFARDASRLGALKREITLFRLLRDAVGESAPIPELFDWNLEQAPFFIEVRHVAGGNLTDWAAKRLEQADWTLDERVELVARIADALSVLHSMGVLHKDLKPSNVLMDAAQDDYRILLCDLGSGGLLDAERIATLGITRMGFTQTLTDASTTSGTPMYLAPEVMMGQPSTTQADLYALGVMLYQIAAGDLAKPLAPGWERDIPDAVLREDIASAVDGDPHGRLGDAAELARRLRSLAQRRHEREERLRVLQENERRAREIEGLRARRLGLIAAVVALSIGMVGSGWMYAKSRRAQFAAEAEAERTRAVSAFLTQDVFASISATDRPVKGLSVRELLDAAAVDVNTRFERDPEINASVHEALGRSYIALEEPERARRELLQALDLYRDHAGLKADQTVDVAALAVGLTWQAGEFSARAPLFQEIIREREEEHVLNDVRLFGLKRSFALALNQSGDWQAAVLQLETLYREILTTPAHSTSHLIEIKLALAQVLINLDRCGDALTLLSQTDVPKGSMARDDAGYRAAAARLKGYAEFRLGNYDEAERQLNQADAIVREWFKEDASLGLTNALYRGLLAIERHQPGAALPPLQKVLETVQVWAQTGLDQTYVELLPIGQALALMGQLSAAEQSIQQALLISRQSLGERHPITQNIRVELADVMRREGRAVDGWAMLRSPFQVTFDELGPTHGWIGRLHEVQAALMTASGDRAAAKGELVLARQQYVEVFGAEHWRTRQIDQALHSEQDIDQTSPNAPDRRTSADPVNV